MIGICLNMTDLDLFFILQGTLPWQPVKVKNQRFFFADQSPLSHCPVENGLQYRNSNCKTLNRMNFSTQYTILVTYGPLTPEIGQHSKNRHIRPNITATARSIFVSLSA